MYIKGGKALLHFEPFPLYACGLSVGGAVVRCDGMRPPWGFRRFWGCFGAFCVVIGRIRYSVRPFWGRFRRYISPFYAVLRFGAFIWRFLGRFAFGRVFGRLSFFRAILGLFWRSVSVGAGGTPSPIARGARGRGLPTPSPQKIFFTLQGKIWLMGGVGDVRYYGQGGILLKMVGIGFAKAYIYAWGAGAFFLDLAKLFAKSA